MSGTLGASMVNVRKLVNDLPIGGDPIVSNERLIAVIASVAEQVGAILGFADTWNASAVTLVAGQREYTLSGTEYQTVAMIKRTEDGVILAKSSMAEIEAFYQSTSTHPGDPTAYAIYEDSSQAARIRLFPTPDLTNALHLDTFTSGSMTALAAASDVIPFSRLGVQAVELLAAADLVVGIDDELKAKKHISGNYAQQLQARAELMLDVEKERRSQFRRQDSVRRLRY